MWDNPDLVLYHGTTVRAAESVRAYGIDLRGCRPDTDFGRGFYTTTNLSQAREWARRSCLRASGTQPAVIVYVVPREEVATLATLVFVRGDAAADDYWDFVTHCRHRNGHARQGGLWYDLVAGPVMQYLEQRRAYTGYDQLSVHTPRGTAVLDRHVTQWLPVRRRIGS